LKRPAPKRKQQWSEEAWRRWGSQVGRQDAAAHSIAEEKDRKKALNRLWLQHALPTSLGRFSWQHYNSAARDYCRSYAELTGIPAVDWVIIPTDKSVSVVMTAMNEEETVSSVLEQLKRLPLEEIVVVVNGSTDRTFQTIRQRSDALIVHYPHALGYDVGRAIGAKLTRSDIVVFVDGDFPIQAEQLVPFIAAVDKGMDVALNQLGPYLGSFSEWDSVSMVKQFLNSALGRADLLANSLTAVPHALSRKAIETIGPANLVVPPKAQALALMNGLNIGAPWSVDVISMNRHKERNTGLRNPVAELIIGDHVEALDKAMELRGGRLTFPDTIRKRQKVQR
jgi:hypothetical protein